MMLKMAKQSLKNLQRSHRTNFKVCLAIFQHYALNKQAYKNVFKVAINILEKYTKSFEYKSNITCYKHLML